MIRTRLISFFKKVAAVSSYFQKVISSLQRLSKKSSVEQLRHRHKARLKWMVRLCGQDGRRFLEDIGKPACLWVLSLS